MDNKKIEEIKEAKKVVRPTAICECGQELDIGDKFCRQCGAELDWGVAPKKRRR